MDCTIGGRIEKKKILFLRLGCLFVCVSVTIELQTALRKVLFFNVASHIS